MTSLYRNHFADGSCVLGCGLARLDEGAKSSPFTHSLKLVHRRP